jgi:biotin transport system substrate-specific component
MTGRADAVLATSLLRRTRVTTAALVVGAAVLTALAAQIRVPIPGTPVPVTGQTFAVLLTGAALGARLGAAGQMLYVLAGLAGMPVFQDAQSGWSYATGATGGYLVGFVAAAALVGYLAQRRQDRTVAAAVPAFLAGTVVIYLLGVPWLARTLDVSWTEAVTLGMTPFLLGDLAKAAVAGLLLPASWKLARR